MIPDRSVLRRQIGRAGRFFLLLFVLLALALPYWSVVRAPDLLARPENVRTIEDAERLHRGRIIDANGTVLAGIQVDADGYVNRTYSTPALSPVTGYWSTRFGVSGIEAARDADLSGNSGSSPLQEVVDRLLHRPVVGDDVVLTIDSRIQKAADDALGKETGAIVVLDVHTGAVLALASHPYFDANTLDTTIEKLKADAGKPLLNRATQGLYPPGSTFKTVTLAAGLDNNIISPSSVFTYTLHPPDSQHHGWWHVSDQGILCENHPTNNAPFDLTGAYIWSCNVAFGDIGLHIGADLYGLAARGFGLGRPVPFELPVATSQLFQTPDYLTGQERFYALASTAFGQGQISVTPLQMALVAAAVANDGKMPRPYLVARVQTPNGQTVEVANPSTLSVAMSPATASIVKAMMITSVDQGWAHSASIPGVKAGGKTGTAEIAVQQDPHSWFIGFLPGDTPRYAIAVVMEGAGFGSSQAAPAAKKVMEAIVSNGR